MANFLRKVNDKSALILGVIFRYYRERLPARKAKLMDAWRNELAPPKPSEWPVIKRDWNRLVVALESDAYRQLTIREAIIYVVVLVEIGFWFFAGEVIGRRNFVGYVVPATYSVKKPEEKVY